MAIIDKILTLLQGKKTTVMSILALLITFSLTKGYIDNDLAVLLNGILVALGFGANIAGKNLGNRNLGRGIK